MRTKVINQMITDDGPTKNERRILLLQDSGPEI